MNYMQNLEQKDGRSYFLENGKIRIRDEGSGMDPATVSFFFFFFLFLP